MLPSRLRLSRRTFPSPARGKASPSAPPGPTGGKASPSAPPGPAGGKASGSPTGGKTLFSDHFSLVWGSSNTGGGAVVISKKVASRSVDRHLLKRRILSLIRPHCSESRFLVVYAKKGSSTLPFKEISKEITELLKLLPL